MNKNEKNQSVMKSAALMSLGTLLSRILGFGRDAAVAALFSRTVTDVFAAAFALPNFFRRLLGEGSLSVSFIPVFVDRLHAGDDPEEVRIMKAKRLSHAVFTLLLGVSLLISLLLFIFMKELVILWLGEKQFLNVPGKLELAVALSRITIFYLALVTTYAYFMAIAQALKKFFLPSVAPAFFNLVFILILFVPDSVFHIPERKLAWAVIFGGVVQLLIVAYQLARLGYLPHFTVNVRLPGVAMVLKNMAPGIVGLGASQLMNVMNQKFAAGLAEGAMTHVYYTNRLLELPQSLIAISIGTALLPTLAQLNSEGKTQQMIATSHEHIKMLLFLSLPSALGLFLLSRPIVSVLFERGMWSAEDTQVVSHLVEIIALMLLFAGFSRVLIPGFYAVKNTMLPAVLTTITVTFHIFLAPQLMQMWGIEGLIWSVTISGFVGLCLSLGCYYWLIGPLRVLALLAYCLWYLPGLLVMAAVCYFGFDFLDANLVTVVGARWAQVLSLFGVIVISAGLYFIVGHFLKIRQAHAVTMRLKTRLRIGKK